MRGPCGKSPPLDLLVDVTLVCMFCGKKATIHVFRDRRLPEKIIWECFDCQKREEEPAGEAPNPGGGREDDS